MNDEQVQKLLVWFVGLSETNKMWADKRKKALEENHEWIQPDVIQEIPAEELETRFVECYRSGGGRQAPNQIYRDRIIRDKNRFRKTLLYLSNKGIIIENRIDQILGDEYRIEGFGKGILTSFLMDYNPNKYCLWNNKTDMGFSVIGWKAYESRDSRGTAYLKVLDALQKLIDLRPELNLTFVDVDLFLHTISAEEKGREAVRTIMEGREISRPAIEHVEQIPKEVEGMEFAMERYLEEFIEANFDKISFGAKLELYQDEESSGRQYPTPTGNIDLLAVDKEKNEFAVIKLKKGRTSDVVIGQILRYMGWAKDHLAKDYNVRGIVIAREKDERLEYTLKLLPNVNLFVYSVFLKLEGLFSPALSGFCTLLCLSNLLALGPEQDDEMCAQ